MNSVFNNPVLAFAWDKFLAPALAFVEIITSPENEKIVAAQAQSALAETVTRIEKALPSRPVKVEPFTNAGKTSIKIPYL